MKRFKLPGSHRLPDGWLCEWLTRPAGVVFRICPNQPKETVHVLLAATKAQRRRVPEAVSRDEAAQWRRRNTQATLMAIAGLAASTFAGAPDVRRM